MKNNKKALEKRLKFRRCFSVPVLDEPFKNSCTVAIHGNQRVVYGPGCQVIDVKPSFSLSGTYPYGQDYIDDLDLALKTVDRSIKEKLDGEIACATAKLEKLQAAKKIYDEKGIDGFLVSEFSKS